MGRSYTAFRRGQVYFVDDHYKPLGSIQGKSRPYVVVSNDLCNKHSPVIHMAPITSKLKKQFQPTHIEFLNPSSGKTNWVLCEQTMPKSVPDIDRVSRYQFTMDPDIMKEVDKALAIQFSLRSYGVDLSEFETMLDMIVAQKIEVIQEATQSMLDSRVSKYVTSLLDRVAAASSIPEPKIYIPGAELLHQIQYGLSTDSEESEDIDTDDNTVSTIDQNANLEDSKDAEPEDVGSKVASTSALIITPPPKRPASAIDRFNARWNSKPKVQEPEKQAVSTEESDNVTTVERPTITYLNCGRIRWTPELKRQFLIDLDSYDKEKVAEIWNLSTKSFPSYRARFENEVESNSPKQKKSRKKSSEDSGSASIVENSKFQAMVIPREEILQDYDTMPISKFMKKYNIPTRSEAVQIAARLRIAD